MNKTRIIAVASILALAGAGQASAGGLTGLGIVGNKTGGIVIAPSVGVGDILSNNNKNNVLTGILNNQSLGGPGMVTDWVSMTTGSNGIWDQFVIQAKAVGVTVAWSGVVSFVAYKLVDLTIGLRVTEDEEREGLDITSHGETAYAK